jgi:hypothetical protein
MHHSKTFALTKIMSFFLEQARIREDTEKRLEAAVSVARELELQCSDLKARAVKAEEGFSRLRIDVRRKEDEAAVAASANRSLQQVHVHQFTHACIYEKTAAPLGRCEGPETALDLIFRLALNLIFRLAESVGARGSQRGAACAGETKIDPRPKFSRLTCHSHGCGADVEMGNADEALMKMTSRNSLPSS